MERSYMIETARAEAMRPAFAITKQILDVHSLVIANGKPEIAGTVQSQDGRAGFVFFSIAGEPYHLWVRVGLETHQVEFSGITPLTQIELLLRSAECSPEMISSILGMSPSKSVRRGEQFRPNSAPSKFNLWRFEPVPAGPGFFDDRLGAFLGLIEPIQARMKGLPADCEIEVSVRSRQCAAWPDGFHINPEAATIIAQLGASLDIDVSFSGPSELGA